MDTSGEGRPRQATRQTQIRDGTSQDKSSPCAQEVDAGATHAPVLWRRGWGKRQRLAVHEDGGACGDGAGGADGGGGGARTLRISVESIEAASGGDRYVSRLTRRAADEPDHFGHIVRVDATLCTSMLHFTPTVMCRFALFLSKSLASLSELVLSGCGIETPAAHRILRELGLGCWKVRPSGAAVVLDLSGNAICLLQLCKLLQADGVAMNAVGTLLFCEQSCGVDDSRAHAAPAHADWARSVCATFPEMVRLHLSRNAMLTGEFMHDVVKGLPRLQEIALDGCAAITPKGLSSVRCALIAVAENPHSHRQPSTSSAAASSASWASSAPSQLHTAPRLHVSMRGICSTAQEWGLLIREAAKLRTLRGVDVLLLHDVADREALADSGGAIGLGGGRGCGGRTDRAKAAAAIRKHERVRVVFCGQLRLPDGGLHIVLQSRGRMPADRCIADMAMLAQHALTRACMAADVICPGGRRQQLAVSREFDDYVAQLRDVATRCGIMGSTFEFCEVAHVEMIGDRGGVRLRHFGPVPNGVLLPPPEDGDRLVSIYVYTKRHLVDA